MTTRPRWIGMLGLVLLAMGLRAGACIALPGHLSDDRDVYLAIARGIADGRGFSSPGSTTPTAFRPPLYPLLLAHISDDNDAALRAALHCGLAGAMTACVLWLAALSGLSPGRQLLAGVVVAIDPLLVYYATFPMTESLAAAGSAFLLATGAAACKSSSIRVRTVCTALGAIAFGICVMTRPTYWAFALLVVAFGAWQFIVRPPAGERHPPRRLDWILGAVLTVAIVSPWIIRNWLVVGRPIVTTTHGGYTLLLGNNAAYYREVVEQPLGTVWDGSHGEGQAAWATGLMADLEAAGVDGELATDQWMKTLAWQTIREHPVLFLRASLRRFLAFWSVRPHADSASRAGRAMSLGVTLYYSLLWIGLLAGGWNALRQGGCAVELCLLLIAAFVAVHLIYWTDARMRAPIMPAVAVLAARAGFRKS